MKKFGFVVLVIAAFAGGLVIGLTSKSGEVIRDTIIPPTPVPTPLARYSMESLSAAAIPEPTIVQDDVLKTTQKFNSYLFTMDFSPTFDVQRKKTTGLLNIPAGSGPFPLIVMIRGYVDQSIYQTGIGTKNGAEFFAENGYMTISPDFLGYAGSDEEAGNIFETRFQTYTTFLSLLQVINTPTFRQATEGKWDGKNIFIWAHSNGGQVTLTTLAVTAKNYPTVLWAPVTKQFPYSILYYTDESADGGEFIRRELSKFESIYDAKDFSFTNYLDRIQAPLQIHQGTADSAIPVSWTQEIVAKLKKLEKDVTYFQYPGSDHNLRPAWDEVIARDLEFYKKHSLQ